MKNKLFTYLTGIGAIMAPILIILIVLHIIYQAAPALTQIGPGLWDIGGRWQPLANTPSYSLLPMIAGTLYVSCLAVLLAVLVGLGCAIFLNLYANRPFAQGALIIIDMLAGVPSVIFGFLGLVILVKQFEKTLAMSTGECVLSAVLLLFVMLLPYVISNCYESLDAAKKRWMNTAGSLGFSKEYSIRKIILPGIRLGITSSMMMAFGRALGETMAVMMVIGNSPIYPKLLGRSITIAGLTALEIGSAEYGSLHMSAIYAANLFLLVILILVLAGSRLLKKQMEKKL